MDMVLNVVIAYMMPHDKVEVKSVVEELAEYPAFIIHHVLKKCCLGGCQVDSEEVR